ncbi:penicillin-binding protein 2 [Thermocatellispora tengchongensis]|uniref:Penicillin-binding protein 2 n=1 Tax=Thermocatellispora tengchongensis TaxID=1073253 RepID=A0A840PJM2_9ACTN|nr:penicillin-binding protein 2 [Thermocatellispora tengchongensis]MBB5138113.1 penicillin-binding protein 2 [Thermocatellispora tengchongensis]
MNRRGAPRARLAVLHVVVVALLLTLLGRLWQVQIMSGAAYEEAAVETRVRQIALPALRGQILDREGRPLVANRSLPVVSVDHMALRDQPDGGRAVLTRLAGVLGQSYADLAAKTRLCTREVPRPCWPGSPYEPIPVTADVDVRTAFQIMERAREFPGVSTGLQPIRSYPYGTAAAQVLGYLQPAPREEAAPKDATGVTMVGRAGLEAVYERDLAGTPGRRLVAVDSAGRVGRQLRQTDPVPGNDLVTSIDADVQQLAEQALGRATRRAGDGGAAVVMEARTGRVVALAGAPTYDPNVWTGGITTAEYERLFGAEGGRPLLARAVAGEWAPGSTWKVVSASAAINAGYSTTAWYDCPGSYRVGARDFRNYRGLDLGPMDIRKALVVSCDTIFYRFAEELWRRDGGLSPVARPADVMQRTARAFGFGEPTGIDLPGEAAGRVPGRAWKKARAEGAATEAERREAATWWPGDAANFSIGQGDVLVTPVQLARAYAAIANGGTLFSPRVAQRVQRDGEVVREIEPQVVGRLPVSAQVLAYIRSALADVTRVGTAEEAFKGFPRAKLAVAGKTGTAEVAGRRDTSWFASFAPAASPEYVVVVMVSQGGKGGDVAAPVAREIWAGMYGLEDPR